MTYIALSFLAGAALVFACLLLFEYRAHAAGPDALDLLEEAVDYALRRYDDE